MNSFILLAATAPEGAVQEIARTFGFTLPNFIAQVFSFLIVAFLLYKFAYKKVLIVLEARRQEITQSLTNAEKIKAELASTEAARRQTLEQANAQENKLIEEA